MIRTTIALAGAETRVLLRNTTAWATAIALPLFVGAMWALNDPPIGEGWSAVIVLQIMVLLIFTLHTVGTMALASRRQHLVLKRWRGSEASDLSVLTGSIAVPAVLTLLQTGILTAITMAISGERPQHPTVVLLAVIAAIVTVAALTFAAAAFTRSPEHAMITTLPVLFVLMIGTFQGLIKPVSEISLWVLAVPGAAATQLITLGWDGAPGGAAGAGAMLADAAPSIVASVALTVAAVLLAVRTFRWEPRS